MTPDEHRLFANIRSALQATPSAEAWAELIDQLASWRDRARFAEQVLPYTLAHLERWPDALRVVPARWQEAVVRGIDLPWTPVVRALCLDDARLTDADVAQVVYAPVWRHLTHLSLRGSPLRWQSIARILGLLTHDALRALDLSFTWLGDDGAEALAMSETLGGLESLRLDDARLSARGVGALLLSERLGALHTLTLDQNDLANASLERPFSHTTLPLRTLHMNHTDASPQLLGALCAGPLGRQLEVLELRGNALGLRELVSLTRRETALRVLDLSDNRIGDQAIGLLSRARGFQHLHTLDLSGSLVTSDAIQGLVRTVNLPALRVLGLGGCGLAVAELVALLRARSIERLILRGGDLSTYQLTALQESRPQTAIEVVS